MNFSTLKKLLSEVGIEISNSQLSFYASGKRKPKDKKLWLKIAEVLDVKLEYLITDTDYYLQIIEEKTDKSSDKK